MMIVSDMQAPMYQTKSQIECVADMIKLAETAMLQVPARDDAARNTDSRHQHKQ